MAARRHSLLVGPIGCGKSHLLRAVARELPRAVSLESLRPLRGSLLALGQALHGHQVLRLPGAGAAALDWPACAKALGRLTVPELTDVLVASLHDRGLVLCLDQLESLTPSKLPTLERLLAEAVVVGATRQRRRGLEKLWWAFDRIDVPPLTRDEARELLWTLAARHRIADPALFESRVLAQANGNPYAVVELVRQVAGLPAVSPQAIRDLTHGAGIRYLDLTPALLLVGAGLVTARFVALGLDDRDLYILAGSLGALFVAVRYLLLRGGGSRG